MSRKPLTIGDQHPQLQSKPGLATWDDLPFEILDQILILCDTPILVSLSQVNRAFNRLALEYFFKIQKEGSNPICGRIVSVSLRAPTYYLSALNSALWLDHLPYVLYFLNPNIRTLFYEVQGLTRLIQRTRAITELELDFVNVDMWLAGSSVGRRRVLTYKLMPRIDIDVGVWMRIWVRLLEVALMRGCESMSLVGADWWEMHYVHDSVPAATKIASALTSAAFTSSGTIDPGRRTLGRRLIRGIKKRLGIGSNPPTLASGSRQSSKPTRTPLVVLSPSRPELPPIPDEATTFQTAFPCLTYLRLQTSMMVQQHFLPHTLNLIQTHSPVLRHLELVNIRVEKYLWQKFLSKITLPVLERFKYLFEASCMEEPVVTPQLLLDFFVRHPTIRQIDLVHGISVEDPFPPVESTLLPNLRHLDAHPRIVSWLLQHPIPRPELRFVSLTSEYPVYLNLFNSGPNPYENFDDAIRTLSNLAHPEVNTSKDTTIDNSSTSRSPEPHEIHIQFRLSTERGFHRWLLSHAYPVLPTPYGSPIRNLNTVTRLTLSGDDHTDLIPHLPNLPRFLGLFPNLRWLEMVELLGGSADSEVIRENEGFVSAVKGAVKGLQRWSVEGVWVVEEEPQQVETDEEYRGVCELRSCHFELPVFRSNDELDSFAQWSISGLTHIQK